MHLGAVRGQRRRRLVPGERDRVPRRPAGRPTRSPAPRARRRSGRTAGAGGGVGECIGGGRALAQGGSRWSGRASGLDAARGPVMLGGQFPQRSEEMPKPHLPPAARPGRPVEPAAARGRSARRPGRPLLLAAALALPVPRRARPLPALHLAALAARASPSCSALVLLAWPARPLAALGALAHAGRRRDRRSTTPASSAAGGRGRTPAPRPTSAASTRTRCSTGSSRPRSCSATQVAWSLARHLDGGLERDPVAGLAALWWRAYASSSASQ